MWGGKLPSTWEPIDAEMYAILAYLRKMASASDAQSRRCLVLCDCKPALQQIENAHRKGMPEGLRDWERGGLLEAIAYYLLSGGQKIRPGIFGAGRRHRPHEPPTRPFSAHVARPEQA